MAIHLLHLLGGISTVAERELPAFAVEALWASDYWQDDDSVPRSQVSNAKTNFLDNANGFVALD
jgi:hypothetical protein